MPVSALIGVLTQHASKCKICNHRNILVQVLLQVGLQLDRRVVRELSNPAQHPYPECAKIVPQCDISIDAREAAIAQRLVANKQLFLGAQFCSVATDAVRAGFLNRQNIAAFTLGGVGTWGAPQVMCDIVPKIFSLAKSKNTL